MSQSTWIQWLVLLQTTGVFSAVIKADKNCSIKYPCFDDCDRKGVCEFLISWEDTGAQNVYTLRAQTLFDSAWMAIAFSDDRKMGNDSVTGCKMTFKGPSVFNALNPVQESPKMLDAEGSNLISASLEDGVFYCQFTRVKEAGLGGERFDLNTPWFILFSRGGLKRDDSLGYHGLDMSISTETKILPSFTPKPTPVAPTTPAPATPATPTTPAPATPGPPTTPPLPPVTSPPPATPAVIKEKGCGINIGCFSDCVGTRCNFLVWWQEGEKEAVYTLTSRVDAAASWLALGFSSDKVMDDDDVLGCVSSQDGRVAALSAWNPLHSTPELYQDQEVQLVKYTVTPGVMSCTLRRPLTSAKPQSGSRRVNVSHPWTLLFAKGKVVSNSNGVNLQFHGPNFAVSEEAVEAQDKVDLGASYIDRPLVKAHASLMTVAWIWLASTGMLSARYLKTFFKFNLCSQSAWFQVHRICMMLVFTVTLIGFVVIFVEGDGLSQIEDSRTFLKGHPIIGIITMVLTTINPVMALFRPHPGTPKRPIFNWVHRLVGMSAYVLAVINICFGIMLTKADVPYFLMYILAGYIIWQIVVELSLLFITLREQGQSESYEPCSQDVAVAGLVLSQTMVEKIKRILLIGHCAVVTSVSFTLVALINLGTKRLVQV